MARRHRDDIIDDDGNIIQPPPPDHPVMTVLYLMEYGRKRGFRIGPTVQVDGTIVQVVDLRQTAAVERMKKDEAPDLEPGSDMALVLGAED